MEARTVQLPGVGPLFGQSPPLSLISLEPFAGPVPHIFRLKASVSSDAPAAVRPALEAFAPKAHLSPLPDGFAVEAEVEGESARELNRALLTALRRAEKRTRLRSEWTAEGVTEKFFDYVPKGRRPSALE